MTDQTPLQRLDDAVHEYLAALDTEGTLGGWVIAYQASYIEDNGPDIEPISWDGSYAVSPGLSPFAAVGLADYVRGVISNVYNQIHDDEDDA